MQTTGFTYYCYGVMKTACEFHMKKRLEKNILRFVQCKTAGKGSGVFYKYCIKLTDYGYLTLLNNIQAEAPMHQKIKKTAMIL